MLTGRGPGHKPGKARLQVALACAAASWPFVVFVASFLRSVLFLGARTADFRLKAEATSTRSARARRAEATRMTGEE